MPGRPEHPTVLAVHLRDDGVMGGCEQYRVRIPYESIRNNVKNAVLDWAPIGHVREWAAGRHRYTTRPTDYDMIVLPRHRPLPYGTDGTVTFEQVPDRVKQTLKGMGAQVEGEAHLMDLVRTLKLKQVVVGEYDDDHWGSRDLGYQEYVDLARMFLQELDAITVTTPYMRRLVKEYAPDVPIYVLPNAVNFGEWQGWKRWKRWPQGYTVLALTGSITHYQDWKVLRDVIPRILKERDDVALLLQGFIPDYFEDLPYVYPGHVYADRNFVQYEDYPGIIRQADIVLAPVDPEDRFNWAKSNIKAVEGMAAGRELSNGSVGGAAIIASPLAYYKEAVYGRGIIADHEPDAWYSAIMQLVNDKELRMRYQQLGHTWVKRNRSAETVWQDWWNAYRKIYRRQKRWHSNQDR